MVVEAWVGLLDERDREELIRQAHRDARRIRKENLMAFSNALNKHFNNPAVMRQHERDAAAPKPGMGTREVKAGERKDMEPGEHGPVHKVEMHHPDGAENPSPGMHHVVMKHADGHEEHSDHASAEEAHDHAGSAMRDEDEVGGDGEGSDMEGQEHEGVCPECGGDMVDGECQECDYKDGEHEMAGQGGDQEVDENGGY